ncbi:MAG: response regulator transcription factor [Blautia sp.]|uniref:response regulator transcription factor n=1 Tax=Blautia sp. TaxID=1955243 RepID=UPI00257A3993|nr:response regulator transcription factor [Blautia sp.]MBS5122883.1 response regulator transcription factor [Blautia sp.]
MLIFLIEDDEALAEGISFMLVKEGYETERFSACSDSRRALEQIQPDLILLDWNLPDGDGLMLCREISEKWKIPILMITARDMEIDQVMCLESGADDYIAKPFSLAVLKARIAALLRRQGNQTEKNGQLISGQIRVDNKEMRAWKDHEELDLSLTEYRLLKYFLENKNQVLLKEQILSHVWDNGGRFVEENTLMVNIRRLRTKVEKDASHPEYIKTVHGMGYLWEERK